MNVGRPNIIAFTECRSIFFDIFVLKNMVGSKTAVAVLEDNVFFDRHGRNDAFCVSLFRNISHSLFYYTVWCKVLYLFSIEDDLTAFCLSDAVDGFSQFSLSVAADTS